MELFNFENENFRLLLISAIFLISAFILSIWLYRIMKRILKENKNPSWKNIASVIQYPFKALVLLIAIVFIRSHIGVTDIYGIKIGLILYILFLTVMSWLGISIVKAIKIAVIAGYDVNESDNLKARKMHTQMRVFERITIFLILFITLALILLSFETIREIGVSLLASAGIAGLIIGFAAQKSISMLLAGFQIAITQPIRIDDVVIVEGEWGRIEEITLTYVVVAIWDKRRLVVPVNYFIDTPFQNWTRQSADILGSVFIYVDYGFPVDKLRAYMDEALANNPWWDGNVKVLQVTDCTEKSMELRALASAKDSPSAWDLRVKLREDLLEFLRLNYPEYLPRTRVKMVDDDNFPPKKQS
ncbi:mechanosensitive ion channel family protein [Natronoflexus pectinivorans]|uniref:Small-conductance mechanosensitive channel n=1 Tax=Natronoflexus pectinivorans TaxID=682526 RepID=A0A4V2RWN2_9BACT|nr:mechanosensitive ion channel domain-containing protein [Natronoflexus pectinivorans]TCO09300.1 small-conductance mechanosensitive channel [Natronoflexus pectinivorans]